MGITQGFDFGVREKTGDWGWFFSGELAPFSDLDNRRNVCGNINKGLGKGLKEFSLFPARSERLCK